MPPAGSPDIPTGHIQAISIIACRDGRLAISCAEPDRPPPAAWSDLALSFGMFFAVQQM